jgi:putative transcriptional regulator
MLDTVENDVRELRTAEGISQADLGVALGVSRQTVIAIERGRYDPSLPLAIKIARYFGLSVEEVFHVDGH